MNLNCTSKSDNSEDNNALNLSWISGSSLFISSFFFFSFYKYYWCQTLPGHRAAVNDSCNMNQTHIFSSRCQYRERGQILKIPILTRYNVLCFHIYCLFILFSQHCDEETFFLFDKWTNWITHMSLYVW